MQHTQQNPLFQDQITFHLDLACSAFYDLLPTISHFNAQLYMLVVTFFS
jgi:hypothetical protein